MIKITNVETTQKEAKFEVEVDGKLWETKLKTFFNQATKNVKVEGFRHGKAPLNLLASRVNMNEVYNRAINQIANEVLPKLEETKEFNDNPLEILERPSINVKKMTDKELTLEFVYDKIPEVKVSNYKKLDLELPKKEIVTDKKIDSEIEKIQKWNKSFDEIKNRALQKDDTAIIDFTGFIDDKEFSGGKGKDFELKIGSKQFIDNFEDQLIGMNIGETRTIEVKFPKDYHAKDFANKLAKFEVTLNGIKVEKESKLDDKFVENLKYDGVKTIEDLRKYIKNQLEQVNKSILRNNLQKDILLKIIENTEIENIPEVLLSEEKARMYQLLINELKKQNLTIEKYMKENKLTKKDIEESVEKDSINAIKYALAVEQIAKEEKLEITEKEYEEYATKLAKLYNLKLEDVLEKMNANKEFIKQDLLNEKILDFIIDSNYKSKK